MQYELFELYQEPSGWPKRPKKPESIFFCLLLDTGTARCVRFFTKQFVYENHLPGKLRPEDHLHLSLQHVGNFKRVPRKYVYAAQLAGNAIAMHPFGIRFRFITSFEGAPSTRNGPPNRPLVLLGEGDALLEFNQLLGAALEKNGLKAARFFTPHVTLLYGPKRVPTQAIEPIFFTATELYLIHSERGLSRYNIIDHWPLVGRSVVSFR